MVKVIAQQERQALRRTKGEAGGPKDDLELEREALLEAQRASGCGRCVGTVWVAQSCITTPLSHVHW